MNEMLFGYYRDDLEREAAAAMRSAQVRRVMAAAAAGVAQPAPSKGAPGALAWLLARLPLALRRQSAA